LARLLIFSPLLALMRNQFAMAGRLRPSGGHDLTRANTDEWDDIDAGWLRTRSTSC